ncbi:MAG: hypothetical protein FWG30_11220 [Eubacteriaceae bacterium]|nr:hypothetical protein [Eubacteriaceae bacterium]
MRIARCKKVFLAVAVAACLSSCFVNIQQKQADNVATENGLYTVDTNPDKKMLYPAYLKVVGNGYSMSGIPYSYNSWLFNAIRKNSPASNAKVVKRRDELRLFRNIGATTSAEFTSKAV